MPKIPVSVLQSTQRALGKALETQKSLWVPGGHHTISKNPYSRWFHPSFLCVVFPFVTAFVLPDSCISGKLCFFTFLKHFVLPKKVTYLPEMLLQTPGHAPSVGQGAQNPISHFEVDNVSPRQITGGSDKWSSDNHAVCLPQGQLAQQSFIHIALPKIFTWGPGLNPFKLNLHWGTSPWLMCLTWLKCCWFFFLKNENKF